MTFHPTMHNDLAALISKHNVDGDIGVPDSIIAEYLLDCLDAFCLAHNRNKIWHITSNKKMVESSKDIPMSYTATSD